MAKKKFAPVLTPRFTLGYAKHLLEPEEFKGKTKYKARINIPKEILGDQTSWTVGKEKITGTYQEFVDYLQSLHIEAGGDEDTKNPVKDGDKIKIKKGDNKGKPVAEGMIFINTSSSYKPEQRDAKRNPIKDLKKGGAYGGDVVRFVITPVQFDEGISFALSMVQIIEKNGGAGGYASMLEEEDGYEVSSDDASSDDDEDTDEGGSASDDEDY